MTKTLEILTKHLEGPAAGLYVIKTPLDEIAREIDEASANIGGVSISDLIEILKSDSVYTILRFGFKSPSRCGVDDCDDDGSYDLYELVCELRKPEKS